MKSAGPGGNGHWASRIWLITEKNANDEHSLQEKRAGQDDEVPHLCVNGIVANLKQDDFSEFHTVSPCLLPLSAFQTVGFISLNDLKFIKWM